MVTQPKIRHKVTVNQKAITKSLSPKASPQNLCQPKSHHKVTVTQNVITESLSTQKSSQSHCQPKSHHKVTVNQKVITKSLSTKKSSQSVPRLLLHLSRCTVTNKTSDLLTIAVTVCSPLPRLAWLGAAVPLQTNTC